MSYIRSYGVTSSAGIGVGVFIEGLLNGDDHSIQSHDTMVRTCFWPHRDAKKKVKDVLVEELQTAWQEALKSLDENAVEEIRQDCGVIFASTKGCIEDFIWDPSEKDLRRDPLTPVLEQFLKETNLNAKFSICISNACISSHTGFFVAQRWLEQGLVANVIVISADYIGDFIIKGFSSLQILEKDRVTPFGSKRSGLQLGEAATAIIFSNRMKNQTEELSLTRCRLSAEGHSILRPSPSAEGLRRTILEIESMEEMGPDLIVAHGTGTVINDGIEDEAFDSIFGKSDKRPQITATKWSVGHTLGASGSIDLIAACEMIRRKQIFTIANTDQLDPSLKYSEYLTVSSKATRRPVTEVLVTSMGFGGLCGAFSVGRVHQ